MKNDKIMTLKKTMLMGAFFAVAVTSCAPIDPDTQEAVITATPENTSMYKQINVQKLTPIFVVNFDQSKTDFSEMEKGRLLGFVQAQNAEYGDVLAVELPSFSDAEGFNENRYGAIGSFLEDQGFNVQPKIVRDGLQNSLRVYFTKYVATVDPDCAKGWRKPEGLGFENLPLPHMGCSTASALAQMVDDPKDLIDPNRMGGYDSERASRSIIKYRLGEVSSSGSKSSASKK